MSEEKSAKCFRCREKLLEKKIANKNRLGTSIGNQLHSDLPNLHRLLRVFFSKAKMEIRRLYPLVANVSFFQLRKNSELLSGWMNFKNPKDCALTYDLVKNCPQNGIVVDKMGDCQAAEFKESLKTPKCQFRKKMVPLQNFSGNVDQTELKLL